ncbi:MAG: helix-turn-helix transcriptional regulator [Candidatus Omnitrophica bacterium]|nr:helix-turn-helix transcriptional regulator [Candidatus Omnitrophota bacterium]
MNDHLLQIIKKIPLFKYNRELFRQVSQIEIELRRPDGSIFSDNQHYLDNISEIPLSKRRFNCYHQPLANCTFIPKRHIEVIQQTHKPLQFICTKKLRMMLLPILLKEDLVGLVFTGESPKKRFSDKQFQSIQKALLEIVNYIVDNELTPLNVNLFKDNELTRQKELMHRVINYMRQNYHSNTLSLKNVSDQTGISYHYLSRIFKKEMKTTFAQFRNKIRLEAASKLLAKKSLSVSQISHSCGFEDPAYFSKVFRESFGKSPVHYRAKNA